ncbi:hypothetical protein GCM10007880_63110 [Mesorhizobium amorphae]|nr:hypothetical protein GCM10007880_63110 [Mesorhizobium amorphae]
MPQPWGRAMGPAGAVPTQAMAAGASNNVRLLNRLASMSVGRPTASPATQNIYRGLETLVELPHTRPAAPPATSDIYGGLESFVDLPSTPQVRRPAAPQATSDIYGDLESFVELPSTPQVRRPAASQATSDIYGDLESFVELPSTPQVRRPAAPQVPLDIYGGPKSVIEIPSTPQELRDDAQSAPVPARSGAQAGAVAPTPRLHHSVPELGAVDWLSDEHITTDFLILRHELWASNPALAARMRFVDPLVAQMLRAGPLGDAERHFQAIVRGQADNDTADFLFLPVNDANAAEADSGNHWSLLLVDRRDRARPVAYHYDSIRGLHDVFAQQLAQRFGAPLEQPGMAQQPNSYDCGVYLVEGARELVRRLAQRQTPAVLNLDNLVVDRAAVQNRLRH